MIGNKLHRRMPLQPPLEEKLRSRMIMLEKRIDRKLKKYTDAGNMRKLEYHAREKWAIVGMLHENFEFAAVLEIY